MSNRLLAGSLGLLLAAGTLPVFAQTPAKPKLILAIAIDQFRYDYLTRFRQDYKGGLHQMLENGAVFTNARYRQSPTVTAVGHSIMMTGAMPSVSGIVGNTWYDRDTHGVVTSVCDYNEKIVGHGSGLLASRSAPGKCDDADPASPRRLLVSTLGDEMRIADPNARVIGVSLKARSAILPAGHMAQGAYWFDTETGAFISSTFYFPDGKLPAWVNRFNERKEPGPYTRMAWPGFPKWKFLSKSEAYELLPASPWGNELIAHFAQSAIEGEKLGQRDSTDLLAISFSSNDYVGHQAGPDSPEVRDMAIRTDQLLGALFADLDRTVGMANVLVFLTADHGVAPVPEVNQQRRMPGDIQLVDVPDQARQILNAKFGDGEWIESGTENALYLNQGTIAKKNLDRAAVNRYLADELSASRFIHPFRVYTREQLSNGIAGDDIDRSMVNGFYPRRSADVFLVFEPYWLPVMGGVTRTTHSAPFNYDTHVPVILMGPGIRPGNYHANIAVNDIAPTVATMLSVEMPSGSSGRVLAEAFTAH